MLVLAAVLLVFTLPIDVLLLRRHPRDLGLEPDGEMRVEAARASVATPSASVPQAVHDPAFWWLTGSFCLVMFTSVAVTVHLIPYLTDRGYSAGFGAITPARAALVAEL